MVLGAGDKARKWQQNGWVGSRGPLSKFGLWVELLDILSFMGDRVRWIRAPAHMGLSGNEVANDLAVAGMCQSPLWGVVRDRPAPHCCGGRRWQVGNSIVLGVLSLCGRRHGAEALFLPIFNHFYPFSILYIEVSPPWGP